MTALVRLFVFLALELLWARKLWGRRPVLFWSVAALLVVMNGAAHVIKRQMLGLAVLPGEADHLYRALYNGAVTGHYLFGIVAALASVAFVIRVIRKQLWKAGGQPAEGPGSGAENVGKNGTDGESATPVPEVTRRNFLAAGVTGGFALAGAGTLLSTRVRPHEIVVERWKVPVPRYLAKASGFRIVQVTDPHLGPMFDSDAWRRALALAVAEKPDLIALTGDFIDRVNPKWLAPFVEPLAELPPEIPAFAITGNHDHYWGADRLQQAVEAATPVRFIRNRREERFLAAHGIEITGIDDPVSQTPSLPPERGGMPDGSWLEANRNRYRILLAHRPWVVRGGHVQRAFDLTLAGHTHGGMVTLNIPYLPELRLFRPLYDRGWYPPDRRLSERGWLFVSRGVGYAGPRFRLNCPPEVSVLELSAVVDRPERIT